MYSGDYMHSNARCRLRICCASAYRVPQQHKYQGIGRFRIRNRRWLNPGCPLAVPTAGVRNGRELALVGRTPDTEAWSAGEKLGGCGLVSRQTEDRWRRVEDIPIVRTELILATARS